MHITAINLESLVTHPEVQVIHNGVTLTFIVASFSREPFKKLDIFHQLNMYWSSLKEEDQQHVFNAYKAIRDAFTDIWDKTDLSTELNKRVVALLNLFDFDYLAEWVAIRSDVIIPADFKVEYHHSADNHNTRDQTYIRNDYLQLVTLSIIMRSMIPVWGEFISRTRQDAGTTHKEFYAFNLMSNSNLLHTPVFDKLRTYIDLTVGKERDGQVTIINGISSEDFPVWMLGLVCIRRLCIGDIRGTEPRVNLVTFIHKFITQKVNGSESNGANIIKPKLFDDSGGSGDSEAKLSALERYKIKMPISTGEVAELEYSVKDVYSIASRLSHNVTPQLLENSLKSSARLMEYNILEPQMTLLRWILKPIISPVGIKYLSKDDIVKCFGICQAVLWARGHKYLALLATSYTEVTNHDVFQTNIDTRARIPKELIEEITKLYPYTKRIGSKKAQAKPTNLTMHSIDRLVADLEAMSWNMTADASLITEVLGTNAGRRIHLQHDIRISLAKCVIEIAKRDWL